MADVFKMKRRSGKKSAHYYGKILMGPKTRKRVKLFTDKLASQRRLVELQRNADQRAAGIITAEMDHALVPLFKHLSDYFDSLKSAGLDREHQRIAKWTTERIVSEAGWKLIRDISPETVEKVLPLIAKTQSYQNKFITRIKAFCRWLEDRGRVSVSPLRSLKRVSEKGAIRNRARRSATAEQLCDLLALALPNDRRLAYALAALNGLRRNEVTGLTWNRVHLFATIPFLEVQQKQGTDDTLDAVPLHPYVASLLRDRTAGMPGMKVLRAAPDVRTLKKDWSKAGVSMVDGQGKRLDFHALRHTFQTQLDLTGASRAVKKRLMRHAASDVTDGYAHAELADMLTALQRLHSPLNLPAKSAQLRTGTDETVVQTGGPQGGPKADQIPAETVSDQQSADKKNLTPPSALTDEQIAESLCKMSEDQALRITQLIAASSADNVRSAGPSTQVD